MFIPFTYRRRDHRLRLQVNLMWMWYDTFMGEALDLLGKKESLRDWAWIASYLWVWGKPSRVKPRQR